MGWWGKVLGGAFGMLLGGPIGALLGGALGHQFDKGMARLGSMVSDEEAVQAAFFTATFAVMGRLAKADGRVSPEEIDLAEAIMAQMQLDPAMRRVAIHLFQQGKRPDFALDEVLDQFRRLCGRKRNLVRLFIEIQLQAAYVDGHLDPAEARLLEHLVIRLGFPLAEYRRIEAAMRMTPRGVRGGAGELERAYALLGVGPDSDPQEIKRAYRRLMAQHHPDKLAAKGLPEEMMRLATAKTAEIRRAYDVIKKAKGL